MIPLGTAFLGVNMRLAAVFLFLGLLAARPCEATVSADFSAQILAAHNAERTALKLPPLAWSETLAAHAAVWAKHLAETGQPQHSPASERVGEGENLWVGSAGGFTPAEMAGAWAQEKQFFQYGAFTSGIMPGGHVVGHYSQMIWKNTSQIGCAVARTSSWDILVCRYSPRGNLVGEKPY